MGFLNRIFGGPGSDEPQPDISFGRYSDSYKTEENYKAWDRSLESFENEEYMECYRQFFLYLGDENERNVKFWEDGEGIRFELYQGSKKICGYADEKKLKAEAKVAKTESFNVGFMRRLMEQNFDLKYSRFALDRDDNLTIVFDTYSLDGSPYKLYYSLKEVATNADKQDDLLLDEFKMLEPVDTSHLTELPLHEKEVKYNFLVKQISDAFAVIDNGKLDTDQYPGGIAYLLLNLIYRLDYLIKPEGYMMETLERANRLYFAKDDQNTIQKIHNLRKELQKLLDRPKEQFFKEMYRVISTFGITAPVNHDRIVNLVNNDLPNMDWYQEHGHEEVALSIPGFIVGYSLFNYAVPKPIRDLFHLFFKITEANYFRDLGFTELYYEPENNKFNKRSIRRAIDHIVSNNRHKYHKLVPNTALLNYTSLSEFSKSFLKLIKDLDMTKVE